MKGNLDKMFFFYENFLKENNFVLDIGCNDLILFDLISPKTKNVIGVEIAKKSFDLGLKKNIKVIFPEKISSLTESFDFITFFDSIEHMVYFESIKPIFQDIKKVLKPNGLVIVTVPDCDSPFGLRNFYSNPNHLTPSSLVSISWIAKDNGFEIVNVFHFEPVKDFRKIFFNFLFGFSNYYSIFVVLKKK